MQDTRKVDSRLRNAAMTGEKKEESQRLEREARWWAMTLFCDPFLAMLGMGKRVGDSVDEDDPVSHAEKESEEIALEIHR